MIKRDRAKQVIIEHSKFNNITFAAIVQVGDVYGPVSPFSYGEAYGGYRGAPSFVEQELAPEINTRLHFANQTDEDVVESNIWGEAQEVFKPNVRGESAR